MSRGRSTDDWEKLNLTEKEFLDRLQGYAPLTAAVHSEVRDLQWTFNSDDTTDSDEINSVELGPVRLFETTAEIEVDEEAQVVKVKTLSILIMAYTAEVTVDEGPTGGAAALPDLDSDDLLSWKPPVPRTVEGEINTELRCLFKMRVKEPDNIRVIRVKLKQKMVKLHRP